MTRAKFDRLGTLKWKTADSIRVLSEDLKMFERIPVYEFTVCGLDWSAISVRHFKSLLDLYNVRYTEVETC